MQKYRSYIMLALLMTLLVLGSSSCKKALGLLSFPVSDSSSFTMPATNVLTNAVLTLPGITVNSTSQNTFASNNTTADYVQDVTLDKLTLTTTNPSTQNFDFLKSISLYIASDNTGSNKVLLASLSPVPTGQTSIALTPAGNKLDLFLRAKSYTLTTQVELAQSLKQNTDVRVDSRFNVHANLP